MFQHDYGGRPIDSHCPLKANCSQVAWQVHSLRNSRRGSHHAAAGTEIFDRSIPIESNTSLSRGGVARTGALHWHSGGSEHCISGGGTPNRCRETDSHVIPQASFFQGIGVIRGALMAAHSPTGLSFFLLLVSFFEPIASFPQRNFTPGSPRNDDRQLGRPTASPVLSVHMRVSLSRSRSQSSRYLPFHLSPPGYRKPFRQNSSLPASLHCSMTRFPPSKQYPLAEERAPRVLALPPFTFVGSN